MKRMVSGSQSASDGSPPMLPGPKRIVMGSLFGWKSLAIDLKSISVLQTLIECLEIMGRSTACTSGDMKINETQPLLAF